MNEPHVTALEYSIIKSDSYEFRNPPDIEIENQDFHGCLKDNILKLEPKLHFESEEQIRPIADDFIRVWEIAAGLELGRPNLRFRFESSQIIDRNPTPGQKTFKASRNVYFNGEVDLKVIYKEYPAPPKEFNLTPEIELFWHRYCQYLDGRELLLPMAYYCLSVLTKEEGRKKAGKQYDIEFEVLDKLGDLTANRGDGLTARKLSLKSKPLTEEEKTWIETTIKKIIEHIATKKAGQVLTMRDLPYLS